MNEQWQELKETIIELRDSDGTGTQQEVCKFLANYMDVLEKQMQKPETITEFADRCRECGAKYGKLLEQSRWIPVSERLPKDRDWYLGIFKEPDTGWINPIPFICDYVGSKTKATTKEYWILHGFTDRENEHIDYYFNLECIAWQQLPEPYKVESEV